MNAITGYLKAHLAGIGAAVTLLIADLQAGHVSAEQWYGIVGAYLATAAVVAVAPNTTSQVVPDTADQDVDPEVAA